jgi:hypothetical protein
VVVINSGEQKAEEAERRGGGGGGLMGVGVGDTVPQPAASPSGAMLGKMLRSHEM